MRRRLAAWIIAITSLVMPWTTTVGQIPHPDHPGHVHGLT